MNTPAPPRRFRLQLSLRMLLGLMAVIGVALAVFRWPWVEENTHEKMMVVGHWRGGPLVRYRRQITYRRNWRAEPVKNGLLQCWRDGYLWYEATFYEGELHGPRRAYDQRGRLLTEAWYRRGTLHGKFRGGDGEHWLWEGSYQDGLQHGEWRTTCRKESFAWSSPWDISSWFDPLGNPEILSDRCYFPSATGAVVMHSHWQQGKKHGPATWKTEGGELVHTAEYHEGQIVTWNGESIVEQFRQWLTGPEVNDPELAAQLFADVKYETPNIITARLALERPTDDLPLELQRQEQPDQRLVIHLQKPRGPYSPFYLGSPTFPLGPCLCEQAVLHGYGFEYRYGGLWLVPHGDPEYFVDPTGVTQIEFPAGSVQAREWDEVIDVQAFAENEVGCVTRLLAGTSIDLEIQLADRAVRFEPPDLDSLLSPPRAAPAFRRSRRNAIGYVLYRSGCRCELRSGKLAILSSERRTDARRNTFPLILDSGRF